MEMSLFLFTRSIRSRNFILYKYAIDGLLKWMFALDHYHYARWLSVHSLDMNTLEETNNYVYKEFEENGNFVVARTLNRFSSMGLDQRHEQLNGDIKGSGGAIGLTEDNESTIEWNVDATPHWTNIPQASKGLRELIKCNCSKGCSSGNCKYKRASLLCTELCKCKGNCDWNKICM